MPEYHTSSSAVDTTSFMTNNARNYFSFIYEKNRDYIVNRMLLFTQGEVCRTVAGQYMGSDNQCRDELQLSAELTHSGCDL